MVDNFEQIKSLLKFDDEDQFYLVQIIKRKKDNKELGSNSHIVKFYYIKSAEDLDKNKEEMVLLANFHNARVCVNLNKRSFEKTAFHTLKKITDQILNKDFKNVRKAYNSVCGMHAGELDKTWIIDIDEKGRCANQVLKDLDEIQPIGDKLIAIIETKNGVHLITRPFNIQKFKEWFPDIDVHKNNPTIIYIP
jgi:hypothetical protein